MCKTNKRICLDCKGYAQPGCAHHRIVSVGTGFRPPVKTSSRWKRLITLFTPFLADGTAFSFKHNHISSQYRGPRNLITRIPYTRREKENAVLAGYEAYVAENYSGSKTR